MHVVTSLMSEFSRTRTMTQSRHWSVSLWRDPDDVSHCRICPLTKLNGGLSWLHSVDEDAVLWLTSYGKWHAYEKKKKRVFYVLLFYVDASRCFLPGRSCITKLVNTILWKRMNQFCCKLAQVVHGTRAWNSQLLGFRRSMVEVPGEASVLTLLDSVG